jgi:hypothetical protein
MKPWLLSIAIVLTINFLVWILIAGLTSCASADPDRYGPLPSGWSTNTDRPFIP